jgi:hypothetical protein
MMRPFMWSLTLTLSSSFVETTGSQSVFPIWPLNRLYLIQATNPIISLHIPPGSSEKAGPWIKCRYSRAGLY